ncbi:DUF1850 domain-containing protein [Xanthobacteraceae bacterium A53D]
MPAPLLICLSGAGSTVRLAVALTLGWTHSANLATWEEDWSATQDGLVLTEIRMIGSDGPAADEGQRFAGRIVTRPSISPQKEVILRDSEAVADYRICIDNDCRPMDAFLRPDTDPVVLSLCQ